MSNLDTNIEPHCWKYSLSGSAERRLHCKWLTAFCRIGWLCACPFISYDESFYSSTLWIEMKIRCKNEKSFQTRGIKFFRIVILGLLLPHNPLDCFHALSATIHTILHHDFQHSHPAREGRIERYFKTFGVSVMAEHSYLLDQRGKSQHSSAVPMGAVGINLFDFTFLTTGYILGNTAGKTILTFRCFFSNLQSFSTLEMISLARGQVFDRVEK